ncbi:MAG: DNA-binding protein [Actinobacteria bacterium]|nr:DNA-binding protein [Actinomycetota bacterium]
MKRLFLDANVLFTAAHNPKGKAALVIEEGIHGRWALVTSRLAVDEATHNLRLKYPEVLPRLDPLLATVRVLPHRAPRACPVELPAKDRPILQAALDCRATHLLTGDIAHFGPYMNRPELVDGLVIQTVGDFLRSPDLS